MHIGVRIKGIRILKNLEQSKLCDGIVSTSHYSNIESGRYVPSEEVLRSLAGRLEVPAKYFLYIEEKSSELVALIEEYKQLVDSDVEAADVFLNENHNKLKYINSIKQEFTFLIYNCVHILRKQEVNTAQKKFELLSLYSNGNSLNDLPIQDIFLYYYCEGLLSYYRRNFENCTTLFSKALQFAGVENTKYQGIIYSNLALISYKADNNIRKAIKLMEEPIKLFEDGDNWKDLIEAYNFQGVFFAENNEFKNAITSYKKAMTLCHKHNYTAPKGRLLHNLGIVYYKNYDFKLAIDSYERSLIEKYTINDGNLFFTYLSILIAKLELDEHDSINDIDETIRKTKTLCSNEYEENLVKSHEARLALRRNDPSWYEKTMVKCLYYFYLNKYWMDLEEDAFDLSSYFYQHRKYKKAYYYLNMSLEARDHLYKQRAK